MQIQLGYTDDTSILESSSDQEIITSVVKVGRYFIADFMDAARIFQHEN